MNPSIDPKQFRHALGKFTTGVTIVTTVDDSGADVGVTANSFNSVSLDPPMVLWSLGKNSTNIKTFMEARHFAVHVLAADQDALALRFSTKGIDRFAGLTPARGAEGIPLLDRCAARFQCRTAFQYEGGDHVILVGEVLAYDHCDSEPLVYKAGRFAFAVHKAAEKAAAEAQTNPAAFAPDFLLYQLGRAYFQMVKRLRPELERRGLGDAGYFALSMLGIRQAGTLEELDALLSRSGIPNGTGTGRHLTDLGLVAADADGERISLTPAGQRTLMELLAVAKAASEDAEEALNRTELRLLRQLLGRIIAAGDPAQAIPGQS